ncbi:MAG: suppressor of fused domain protein [Armatimonadetes bacterium]|nr:suppressor of fused domain protein [Armatimonadota bacterium]
MKLELILEHYRAFLGSQLGLYSLSGDAFSDVHIAEFKGSTFDGVTLATCGLSNHSVVEIEIGGKRQLVSVELLLQIPSSVRHDINSWPASDLLKFASECIFDGDSIWVGHTLSPVLSTRRFRATDYYSVCLWPCLDLPFEFEAFEVEEGLLVTFLKLGFLYEEEFAYLVENGPRKLLRLLLRGGVALDELLVFRPSRQRCSYL